MQLLAMLMPLLGLVAFVGFVWLLVVAFRQHVLWGIGVLFLSPITAILFAIKYWQQSKKPFLIYIGSSMASLVIMVMTFSSMGGFEMLGMARRLQQGEQISDEETTKFMEATMDRMGDSGLLSDEDKAELQQMRQQFDQSRTDSEGADAPATATSNPSGVERPRVEVTIDESMGDPNRATDESDPGPKPTPTGHIAVKDARHFVGAQVRVVDHNGHEMSGTISESTPRAIVLTKHLPGGTITYEVRTSEVASLQVLRR